MTATTREQKRIQRLESALRIFAQPPLEDAFGNPVVDIYVKYQGGAGWSMALASKADPRKALLSARKLLGLKGRETRKKVESA